MERSNDGTQERCQGMIHDAIQKEMDHIRLLGDITKGDDGDLSYEPSDADKGKFVKHYSYDKFDEVYVELYEKGALLRTVEPFGGGVTEWYWRVNVQQCFDKARLLGDRSKSLNAMFG